MSPHSVAFGSVMCKTGLAKMFPRIPFTIGESKPWEKFL